MTIIHGWKIVRTDGTTRNGYAWPLVNQAAGQQPVKVVTSGDANGYFTVNDPCPQFEGDGLCLAKTAMAASSGGISLSECVGLLVTYDSGDVLAESSSRIRVERCTVVGIWSPLDIIRHAVLLKEAGMWDANLVGANLGWADLDSVDLSWANLSGANLHRADLTGANLTGANLTGANLAKAHLTNANLSAADLARANLTGAYLAGADFSNAILIRADLTGASYSASTIWPQGFGDPRRAGATPLQTKKR